MKNYFIYSLAFVVLLAINSSAQTGAKTAQSAAQVLYSAWKTKSRTKAKTVADAKAIDKLFGTRFQPKWKFAGCTDSSDTEKGMFQCVYKDASDDLLSVAFDTFKTQKGWRVRWLTFGAEN